MRRIAILLAAVGALMLVPAAQAFAEGEAFVTIEGEGAGEVSTVGGNPEFGGFGEGSPAIECTYKSPGPAENVCENAASEAEPGTYYDGFHAVPAPGSYLAAWVVEEGFQAGFVSSNACEPTEGCGVLAFGGGDIQITAVFAKEPVSGPTNLRTLTLTKNANGPGGTGSVSSKPKGIKCGTACSSAVARMYKDTPVELTAKPTLTSAFVEWQNAKEGGDCDGSTNPLCTVPMSEDVSLEAIYSGTAKTITPAVALTLSKGESESSFGKGTVKASGLVCEADCDETKVLYQGPITEPKAKPGKIVILKQIPAFGSKFLGWTGCDSVSEAGECVVEMDEAHAISAEYEALPSKVLTVNKTYSSGNGSVSSKPKGIKCATTCTQAVASMPEGAAVELLAKPGAETTFVKWEGGDCDESTNPVCVVTMDADETTKAVFSKGGKAFLGGSEPTLTLSKEGSGYGTVKAAGLVCEVLCTSTSVLYQGPITEPKPKAGKVVILKATSAPGSTKVAWTGCDSVSEAGECTVEMDEAHAVSAKFDELE